MKPLIFPVSVDIGVAHQLFVSAVSSHLALVDYDNSGAAFDGGQSGGQEQDRAIITESLPCVIEHGFGIRIEWYIGFLNDEESGFSSGSASEAQSKPLSCIQLQAMFTECRFVAAWQTANEVIGMYKFGGINGLLSGEVWSAAGDVFEDRGVEDGVFPTDEDGFFAQ